ncbi:MAG: ABC transporter ATP-binding protein [Lachnospiraceae bacterium]|nr:ABC transporter ATP-binding protein [Lachnospiraceae bacterium]
MIEAKNVSKRFVRKRGESNFFFPVREVSLKLEPGELTALYGASGSGKSTLLNMLAGILAPTEGTVLMEGESLYDKNDESLSLFRNENIGVLPQVQSAISSMTVLENILLPLEFASGNEKKQSGFRKEAENRALQLLEQVGMKDLAAVMPRELSGGELKRMAIVRSLIRDPKVILADEPTADLDEKNTVLILGLLKEIAKSGKAVMIVTHDKEVLGFADQIYDMKDGCLRRRPEES